MSDLIHDREMLGKNLRNLRISANATVEFLSAKTGLSKSFISLVETGKRGVKFTDLRRWLAALDHSLMWFLSRAQDAGDEIPIIAPHSCVQTRKHALLLDGKREPKSYRLLLLRPLLHKNDSAMLELTLPPNSQMTEENIVIPCTIRGYVAHGTLLLVIQGDEFIIREGEEFRYDGKKPHLFRNYTEFPLTAILLPEQAVL